MRGGGLSGGLSGRFDKVAAAVALLLGHLGLSLPKGAQLVQNVVEKAIRIYEFTLWFIKNRGFSKSP
jgi:hypothetical protein